MLTAHLPAGYVLGRLWPLKRRAVLGAALVGSVLPDFDMLWFHLVDDRAFHHHLYLVHKPLFWVCVGAVTLIALRLTRPRLLPVAAVVFTSILLHLVLDSIGGGIAWLWPVSDRLFSLVSIPATRSHWVWSFVFHWTFLAELAIWAGAIALFVFARRADPGT